MRVNRVGFWVTKARRAAARVLPWGRLYGPAVMLAMVPTMTSFLGNRYQVSVQDLIVPVIVAVLTAALVTAVFWRLWRRDQPAGYLAMVAATLILASNFDARVSALQPLWSVFTPMASMGSGPVLALVSIILVLAVCWWLGAMFGRFVKRSGWNAGEVAAGIVVTIAVTFAFQFLTISKDLVLEWPQFFYKPPQLAAAPAAAKSAAKPDIYYIVMEDYAGNDTLKSQFGFENTDFTNFLKDHGYYVNPSAHNNYPYTTMSVASTMSADYLNDLVGKFGKSNEQTVVPFNETVRYSPVAQHLRSLGYTYDEIGNWYEAFNMSHVPSNQHQTTGRLTILGHTWTLNNFSKITLTQSIFARFVQGNLSIGKFTLLGYQNMGDVELAHYELRQLSELAGQKPGGRFIATDVLVPHAPYSFNADGSLNPNSSEDNNGATVKTKYVNSVKYINSQMEGILRKIDENSHGQAVVVMMSDEGPEPFELNHGDDDQLNVDGELQASDMSKWSENDLQLKLNNQAAFHIPAANLDSDDAGQTDAVNVFRLVLNSYFGEKLPYRPDCYYVYPDGRDKPVDFKSVTARVTGQPADARCQDNGTVKP